ncbi:uncharacterized protein J8A68_002317 [[Candida] subhashii]|uniref:RNase H type-1 domain-containing protein n=1 Tax=[Candida] subhashii TaxID=561895 RepID=A0A8J5QM64_9ASCO|nr:uncharacterized protein J8A68_002317 [[Candida] subhashii]KAG7664134.1 hypothetical protein J8A68_002317 [[Candida] subhashii]
MVRLKDSINLQYASKGWSDINVSQVKGRSEGNLANQEADELANSGSGRGEWLPDETYYSDVYTSLCWKRSFKGYNNVVFTDEKFREFDNEKDALENVTKGGKIENVFVGGACHVNIMDDWPDAGYGLYYGPDDDRNTAKYLESDIKPTKQRVELSAVVHALRNANQALSNGTARRPVRILSESEYPVRCFNDWSDKWRGNGYKNVWHEPIENVDLIKEMVNLKDQIDKQYTSKGWSNIDVIHIEGDCGNIANEEADRLANLGASQNAPWDSDESSNDYWEDVWDDEFY